MQRLFGTDGIRGVANKFPMTAEIALRFAVAAGVYSKVEGHDNRVIIAKDTRLSGYLLESALMAGFLSVGTDVILVGPLPTPAVAMLIRSLRADFGVMISASHNPYQDNGLKLFDRNGYKLSDNCEDNIQKMILEAEHSGYLVAPKLLGKAKRLDDAAGRYTEHVKRSFNRSNSLAGLRIVVDCANGAAYHLAPTIFWELGAEVIAIANEPNGFNINENCGSTHTESIMPYNARKSWIPAFAGMTKEGGSMAKKESLTCIFRSAQQCLAGMTKEGGSMAKKASLACIFRSTQQCLAGMAKKGAIS